MPIYDYMCEACGRVEEVMHGVHEQGPSTCPACGGRMRKALSAPAIVFKGTGWAKLDARRSTGGPAADADAADRKAAATDKGTESGDRKAGRSDEGKTAAQTKAAE